MQKVERLGELDCTIVDQLSTDQSPELVVVLCHGFGAPATDLVSLGDYLLSGYPEFQEKVRFVFPGAPLRLDAQGMPGGRAWWPLDMEKLQRAMQGNEIRDLRNDCPEQLSSRRSELISTIDAIQSQTGLGSDRIILGGFSQGAMLTTDVALHLPSSPAGLCIWSGTLLCESVWRQLASQRAGLPFFNRTGGLIPFSPFKLQSGYETS